MSIRRLRYIQLISAICFALAACSVAFAQTDDSRARKFDEFGDILASDLIARLDNLAIEVQNEATARAFLVVYRTRRDLPGLSNRYAHRMKSYMVNSRGVSPERVVTVDGGEASCLTQELWIVFPGGAPQPRPDAYDNSYKPSVYKFDEHHFSESDVDGYWQEYPLGALEAFAQELQKHPRANGYLIAYKALRANRSSLAKLTLTRERNFLVREFGIKRTRIKTIVGGYREWGTMELWIAQERGAVPIITSYRYSRRR
jgi:hypothetical protein